MIFVYTCRECAPQTCSTEHGFDGTKDKEPPTGCPWHKRKAVWHLKHICSAVKPEDPAEIVKAKCFTWTVGENILTVDGEVFPCLLDKGRGCKVTCRHFKIRKDASLELCCKPIHTKIRLGSK
jgi:hypothetical protein